LKESRLVDAQPGFFLSADEQIPGKKMPPAQGGRQKGTKRSCVDDLANPGIVNTGGGAWVTERSFG
jgi:hypothetical protein